MSINKKLERVRRTIIVRPTQESDIPLIVLREKSEPYVTQWNVEQHTKAIYDPQVIHHMIIARSSTTPVGYAILRTNSPEVTSVEFLRLVISNGFKSRGYGYLYFEYIWDLVFSDSSIKRIWHDVFADNCYAIRLYEKLGYTQFKKATDPVSGRALLFYELTRQSYFARME